MKQAFITRNSDFGFKKLCWVLRAICKDETRPDICCLHVADSKIVATDSHRLHVIDKSYEIPDGNYEVFRPASAIILVQSELIFVENWKRIIPATEIVGKTSVTDKAYFYHAVSQFASVAVNYILSAWYEQAVITFYGQGKPLVIEDTANGCTAYVMPLRKE